MLKTLSGLRKSHARDVAHFKEGLRAQFGDGCFDSRLARLSLAGVHLGVTMKALAPVIAVVFVFAFAGVQSAFGQNVTIRGDSSKLGGMAITIVKWIAIAVIVFSVGGIFWTIIQGLRGNEWQSTGMWSLIGLCSSSVVAWAMDVADNKDPIFDHKGGLGI